MKYAAALARQGELIEAVDASYDSFKQELLHCPHCKSSVYLVKSHNRAAGNRTLRSGQVVEVGSCQIPAFFSHHHLEEQIECEAYNRTISTATVASSITIARNQRLTAFRQRFMDIFFSTELLEASRGVAPAVVRKAVAQVRKSNKLVVTLSATLLMPTTEVPIDTKPIQAVIDQCLSLPYQDWGRSVLIDSVIPYLKAATPKALVERLTATTVDSVLIEDFLAPDSFQLKCVIEALDFLYMPAQRKLLAEIFWVLAAEVAISTCRSQGQKIMSAYDNVGSGVDPRKRAQLPEFLQGAVIELMKQSDYSFADAVDPDGKVVDSGIATPVSLLVACLMTIDWASIFAQVPTK